METLRGMTMTVARGILELKARNATPPQALPLAKTQARIVSPPPAIHRRAATKLNLAAFSVIRAHLATNAHRDVEPNWISPTRMARSTLHHLANKVHVAARPR
jgi:hypothetical protein